MRALLLIAALLIASLTMPSRASDPDRLIELLQTPGHVLLVRHAIAPGNGDPSNFELGNCSTQRNLDERGRRQARSIGQWLHERGVAPAIIWASPWCRCRDTASEMELGRVMTHPGLESFYGEHAAEGIVMSDFRKLMQDIKITESVPNILVTHQVVISAATGEFTGSGHGVVASIDEDGKLTALGALDFGVSIY